MPYVLLIIEDGQDRRTRPADVGRLAYESMTRFSEELKSRGVLKAVESLKTDAVRVAVRDGKRSTVDGPFAESKEIVGGFFLLDCRTREEAVAIACACPAADWATVELREVGPCHGG